MVRGAGASGLAASRNMGVPADRRLAHAPGGASADEAHELLFDDHAGHALHFGEAAGENGGGGHSAFS